MGQTFSLATLSAGSAGIDVPDLVDLTYEKSLGTARLMKCIRARHQHGLVVVKLVVKPFPQLDLGKYVRAIRRERDALVDVPNALGYQRVIETSTNGYLVRQYLYSSLYDRISTRPFLEDIEKKWLSFQLLCSLRDCHARDIYHGDIKTENILVTSWNWLYLTDFSSSFKKTYLPEDNPADFSYYFDTSGRRTCYVAPERFLRAGERDNERGVTWAMDVFSVGCVIAELFLEAPVFSLSQLFKYRKGEYDPAYGYLSKIQDSDIRELVSHMIQLEPESRYSAEEYLNFWRRKAFPEYFYSFLHQYMGSITDPSSGHNPVLPMTTNFGDADERIDRVYYDFDKIAYFLGFEDCTFSPEADHFNELSSEEVIPVQIDIPNNSHRATAMKPLPLNDGALIFLTLVVSSVRNTARATARLRACDLMLAFAERIADEAKLDRVLPYAVSLLNDRADIVKVAAIRTVTQIISLISVVSPVNAYVFTEYIRPRLVHFIPGQSLKVKPFVRGAYALYIATLAHTSSNILDMAQALRADGSIPTFDPEAEDGTDTNVAYQTLFDVARQDLVEHFETHTKALLTDGNASVRRAFLGSVSELCIFFGSTKSNDVILTHLNTYLNDKDWMLRRAFFHTTVGVATFLGGTGFEEFILPLMIQSITDSEEFVVQKVLSSFASMAELGLFQRSKLWEMVDIVARFMVHPNIWIREAAAHFVACTTQYISEADVLCNILPLIRVYLKTPIFSYLETNILNALKKPLPRHVFDMATNWAALSQEGLFWRPVQQKKISSVGSPDRAITAISSRNLQPNALDKIKKKEEDKQWLARLRNIGMSSDDDIKLLVLRDYIWHVASRRPNDGSPATPSHLNNIIKLKEIKVTPHTVFFESQEKPVDGHGVASPSKQLDPEDKTSAPTSHTISDALLDASTAIDDALAQNKMFRTDDEQDISRGNGPEQSIPSILQPNSSRINLTSDSPHLLSSRNPSDTPLDAKITHPSLLSRADSTNSPQRYQPKTKLLSLKLGDEAEGAIKLKHKPSAIYLMNKSENPKSLAETSTTSTNAFGRVDGPVIRDHSQPPSIEKPKPEGKKLNMTQTRVSHTYDGSDPSVLKLLDSLAAENYPFHSVEFGPMVTPIGQRHLMKKAESAEPDKPWRPEGVLVATFGEHTGPINRVLPSPDHNFFITAADDGSVKVWDTLRLERNLVHRSRQTHKHADGAKIKCIAFVENTHTFISCATDGSINVVKVDYTRIGDSSRYGKLQVLRDYKLPNNEYALWVDHFMAEASSIMLLATNSSRVIAMDLRNMSSLYSLQNPVHHGTPTCFCVDRKHNWLLLGTSHGIVDLWDLRFRLRLKAWGLAGGTPIHRMHVHPFKGRGRWVCITGGTGFTDITVWDLEKTHCREVFRAGVPRSSSSKESFKAYEQWNVDKERSEDVLSRFATSVEVDNNPDQRPDRGIHALAVGLDHPEDGREAKYGFFLTGGSDKKLRFWDVTRAEASMVISGLDADEDQPKYSTSHPTATLEVHSERIPPSGPSAPNAAASIKPSPAGSAAKKVSGRPSRISVISAQQQNLLKNHLDSILDVALLESPVGMTVSVDRAGVIYVYQ